MHYSNRAACTKGIKCEAHEIVRPMTSNKAELATASNLGAMYDVHLHDLCVRTTREPASAGLCKNFGRAFSSSFLLCVRRVNAFVDKKSTKQ